MTRAIQKIERLFANWLSCLPQGESDQAMLERAWRIIEAQSPTQSIADRLRILRQLVFRRLYQLDCEEGVPLGTVMRGMTDLAEFCIVKAMQCTHAELLIQYGLPIGVSAKPSQIWPVGMGKLGARELNVSSDIDLIFVYDEDGETNGKTSIPNYEFFAKQVRMVQSMLSDATPFGFVFRVDLALRP
ncbi:MAG: hypothetical protein RLY82_1491, partial [Pseudomonadota bacterium]